MTPTEKKAPPPAAPDIDPDNVTLSAEDMERIRAKARSQVASERKKALEAQALAAALEEIRGKEGLRTGDPVEDELVDITIDTGESADRITINGRAYFYGRTYTVPKHMARSMMEIMERTKLHEHSITDKPLADYHRKPRHTVLTKRGATNAPTSTAQSLAAAKVA